MVTIKELNRILTSQGISQQHIEKMKERRFEAVDFYYNFFDMKRKEGIQKIPLSKLKGLNSGWDIEGRSVYDCFTSIASDSPLNSNSECIVKYTRIMENVNSLEKNGLEFQYNFYESDSEKGLRAGLPNFIHFYNRELGIDCYFSDATHRSICALMFGAPFLTGYVTEYELNIQKHENYQFVKSTLKELYNHTFGKLSLSFLSEKELEFEIRFNNVKTGIKGYIVMPDSYDDESITLFNSTIRSLNEFLTSLNNRIRTNITMIILNRLIEDDHCINRLIITMLRKLYRIKRESDELYDLYANTKGCYIDFISTEKALEKMKVELLNTSLTTGK